MIAHETPRPLTGRGTAARRCCCCCCPARCCRCSSSAPSEGARSRPCLSRRRRVRRARRDMSCVMFTLMSVHESPQPFAGRGTDARRCCRCCCSARACRCPSSARERAPAIVGGGWEAPVRRLAPCLRSCSYMKHLGPLAGRGTVARCCCCCRRCAGAAAVLRAACCCDRCCARWRVAALPLERRRDLSLSVTLHEETEPSKGTANRAHGLVRLALDISKA